VITCWRGLSALSASMGWRFRFHSVHVPYAESLNDEAIDSNMDINCTEIILKHVLDEHEGVKEAVNALHGELAERANAEGLKRAREAYKALTNGDLIILRNLERLRHLFLSSHYHSCSRSLSRTSLTVSLGNINPTDHELNEPFTRG